MEEQLISFETAKSAKEKGFDIHCRFYYDEEMLSVYENEDFPYNSWNDSLFAPTQSLLQRWLREIHYIDVLAFHKYRLKGTTWTSEVYFDSHLRYTNHDYENDYTYEEALEIGLLEGLKLIK